MISVDPITTEILGNHLLSITEEMTAALIKSAFSANIKERWDCSSAILNPAGEVVSEAAHSPIHLGGMVGSARALLRRFPSDSMRPGDIFVSNDPFVGSAVHLNDVTIAAPVFADARLVAFVACVAHHADMGGRVPGGEAFDSRSVYQEGLRLPPVRIFEEGRPVESLLDILATNSRNPVEILGDFRAQFAAVRLGARRLEEALQKQGAETVTAAIGALLDNCERRFGTALASLPPGVYDGTDWADDDWVTGTPFPVSVRLEIGEADVHVDLRDNVDQLESSRNVSEGMLLATVFYGLKAALDPGLPPNSGYARAIRISTREGSIFQPRPPAAVALGTRACQLLLGAMFGALSPIIPERVCAGSAIQTGIQLFGWNPRTGRPFLDYERLGGGFGARRERDGLDGVQFGITNTSNLPIEAAEAEYPIRVERYEVIPNSGGPGRRRGGLGARRDIRVLVDGAVLTAQSGRRRIRPPGLFDGQAGQPGNIVLNPDSPEARQLPVAFADLRLEEGNVIRLETAGGGGFGDPLDRDPLLVLGDVQTGRITRQAALDAYGVKLTDVASGLQVDELGTQKLRSAQRLARDAVDSGR